MARLVPQLAAVARRHGCTFVNIYDKLLPVFDYLSTDGVHLTQEGQKIVAKIIQEGLGS